MEYKNDNFTPLDGVDGELLRSVIGYAPGDMPFDSGCRGKGEARRTSRRGSVRAEAPSQNGGAEALCPACGCGDCSDFAAPTLEGVPLSMVYSPYQKWENIYECEVGFERGTIFKCLDFPFEHGRCPCECKTRM